MKKIIHPRYTFREAANGVIHAGKAHSKKLIDPQYITALSVLIEKVSADEVSRIRTRAAVRTVHLKAEALALAKKAGNQ
jgi:hypothetical protein